MSEEYRNYPKYCDRHALAKSADQDHTPSPPQNAASDQGLQCLILVIAAFLHVSNGSYGPIQNLGHVWYGVRVS